jgi:predicted phosphodiesterase
MTPTARRSARPAQRVALIADVHGNAPALAAVLEEIDATGVDAIVSGGDLTRGPLPSETLALIRPRRERMLFVRGNADRELVSLSTDPATATEVGSWLLDRHDESDLALLQTFQPSVVVDVAGLGTVRVCHGSPRSDEELVTESTPAERVRELAAEIDEQVLSTCHVHVQYERVVDGLRLFSAGSVGMPYEGSHGAYWALLGPGVELRRTPYDVEAACERLRAAGGPLAARVVPLIAEPPTRAEAIEHAERLVFSG